jgi:hypothetical protein
LDGAIPLRALLRQDVVNALSTIRRAPSNR